MTSQELVFQEPIIKRREFCVTLLANPGQPPGAHRKALAPSVAPSPLSPARERGREASLYKSASASGTNGVQGASPSQPSSAGGGGSVNGTAAGDTMADDQLALLLQQRRRHQTQRETLQAQLREKQAEKLSSLETVRQLKATVPLIAKRAKGALSEEGIVAEGDYLKLKEEYLQKSQALASEKARQTQLSEAIAGIGKQLQSLDAEAQRKALAEIQDAQRQRQANAQELSKAADLNARQVLSAPVAGKVQQLAVTTIGGVVQPAQVLMLIVPGADSLEVEVSIQNKDIGFVRVGQK